MFRIIYSRLKNLSFLQLLLFVLFVILYIPAFSMDLRQYIDGNLYTSILFSIEFTFYALPIFFILLLYFVRFPESMERIRLSKWLEFKVNITCLFIVAFISSFTPILALILLAISQHTSEFLIVSVMLEVFVRYFMMFVTIGVIHYIGTIWLKNKWYMTGLLMICFPCFAFLYYVKTDFGNFFKFAFFYLTPPLAEAGHSIIILIPFFLGSILLLCSLCYWRLINQEYLS